MLEEQRTSRYLYRSNRGRTQKPQNAAADWIHRQTPLYVHVYLHGSGLCFSSPRLVTFWVPSSARMYAVTMLIHRSFFGRVSLCILLLHGDNLLPFFLMPYRTGARSYKKTGKSGSGCVPWFWRSEKRKTIFFTFFQVAFGPLPGFT